MAKTKAKADQFGKRSQSPKEHKQWADVASKALKDHGDEGRAIREANAVIARQSGRNGSKA